MGVTKDLAKLRVLHQVDHRRVSPRGVEPDVFIETFLNHRAEGTRVLYRGVGVDEVECLLEGHFAAAEMSSYRRGRIHDRFRAFRRSQNHLVPGLKRCLYRHKEFVEIVTDRLYSAIRQGKRIYAGCDD